MNSQQSTKNTIDLADIYVFFKKNIKNIVLWGILGLIISFIVSLVFITPKYSSSVDILVSQKDGENQQDSYNMQQADLQAINTYKDVIQKDIILKPVYNLVKKQDNYSGSYDNFKSSIDIKNESNSQVFTVAVKDDNPYVAADIANNIGKTFKKKIKAMMKVNNVSIVSKAVPDSQAVFPNKKLFSLVGFTIGLLLGIVISFIKDLFNTTVQSNDFLTEDLNLISLGVVSHIPSTSNSYKQVNVYFGDSDKNLKHRRRV